MSKIKQAQKEARKKVRKPANEDHPAPEVQQTQGGTALSKLIEKVTSWLTGFGSWLFGGLIALNLLVMAPLITVGPVDHAIIIAALVFAAALPLEIGGLLLLRLNQDLTEVKFEEELEQTLKEMGINTRDHFSSSTIEVRRRRRARIILFYCLGMLVLSALLTMIGMTAALWHLAWWIGVTFIAMIVVAKVLVIMAIVSLEGPQSKSRSN